MKCIYVVCNWKTPRSSYLGREVGPIRQTFILDSDGLYPGQNHIFGYFYAEPAHACDEDTGRAHPVHPIAAQHIAEQAKKTTKKQNTESVISMQWRPSRWSSGVLTAVWSRSLHRFHQLLTCWCARLSLFSGTEDHRQIGTQTSSSYTRLTRQQVFRLYKVRWQLHSFHFRFSDNLSVIGSVVCEFWPLDGGSGSLFDSWVSSITWHFRVNAPWVNLKRHQV